MTHVDIGSSDRLFRLLVDSVRDYAIFMLDPRGNVATWNIGAHRIKGYTADEILGQHFSKFYPEDDVRAGKCEYELEVAEREGRFEDEGWRIRKDGSRFWANVVITAVHDETGALVGFAKVTRDLTARKHAERERIDRLAAEERFRLIVESVRDYAIFMLDPTGHVATWNVGAKRIKGYDADEIIGQHFSKFYPPEVAATGLCELELEVAAREGRFEDEGWRVRKDGSTFWANVVITAVRDPEGKLIGYSKVTRDLTERKRAEDERAARLAAEQANRTKDEFLAMLGHELRNPLAPIVTALQLMRLRGDTNTAKEQEVIERQVRHMSRLVDDLLDVSRIARGKIELRKEHLDIRGIVAKAIEIVSPLLNERRHKLEVDLPERELVVDADPDRLTQVFTNLVTNAAKYTEPGGIVRVTVGEENGWASVDVRDNGTGIDPSLLPHVFDMFVQGLQPADRAVGGLGLGLTLVRQFVELHGGSVAAHSPGKNLGSTFTVRIPITEVRRQQTSGGMRPLSYELTKHAHRVMLVDDNEDARTLLAEILESVGHEVCSVGDPHEALQRALTFKPDVAILDIGLPGMDGYELGERIRALMPDAKPRLIALTGYGQSNHRQRSIAAGFDDHLVKPVDLRSLLGSLAK
ncbi:MAG: PAS domain S-box protein [Kofleriaceae bacterium]|nr:PAS domain S-box protein [Kofleriaceae bacterium]